MTANNWTQRVRMTAVTPELNEVRVAARDLAQQGQHVPGKARIVFQTVADVALIGTAVISGALASVHLWKALAPRQPHQGGMPEPAGAGHLPPRHPGQPAAVYNAEQGEGEHNHRTAVAARLQHYDRDSENHR